jgi:methionine-rich copper-binding protein CopC
MLAIMTSPVSAAKKDTKAPTITKTNPIDCDSDVMIESTIIIRFSEKIQKGRNIAKISLKESDLKSIGFSYEIKDNLLEITPKADFKYNTIYTVTVPASAVKDAAGNNLARAYTFNFITEISPAEAAKQSANTETKKYIIEIEANLDGELTEAQIAYFSQILKNFGIDAAFLDIREADEETDGESTDKSTP